MDKATLHIGAIAFINRFGSSLDGHVHFHVCVVDGVFGAVVEGHWTSRNLPFVTDSLRCRPVSELPAGNVSNVDVSRYIDSQLLWILTVFSLGIT